MYESIKVALYIDYKYFVITIYLMIIKTLNNYIVSLILIFYLTFDTMTAMARFSECAATYPNIMIPGRRMFPLDSPT